MAFNGHTSELTEHDAIRFKNNMIFQPNYFVTERNGFVLENVIYIVFDMVGPKWFRRSS